MISNQSRSHLRRWGAVYVIGAWFVVSWAAQLLAMRSEIETGGWETFWAATFENWQSEALQLVVQGVALLALKHIWFAADAEDQERLEAKLDELLRRTDPKQADDVDP